MVKGTVAEALHRADDFFMGRGPVFEAATRIAKALKQMEIPFAIAGALAVNLHGHERMTSDVDLLLRREDLASGMTAPDRPRDFDDVIQLIRKNDLPDSYGDAFNPYVHESWHRLWTASRHRDEY